MSVSPALVLTTILLTGSLTSSLAFAQANSTGDSLPAGALATVNDRPIYASAVEGVAQQITASGESANESQILDELINLELLTQQAEAMGLDKSPEVSAALQLQYTQTMANAYLAQQSAGLSFSDEQLMKEYSAQSEAVDRAEYRASHILLENKADAQKVLSELAAGKAYEDLARQYSIDPTGDNGGDIGWFQSSTLPAEFIDAVEKLNVGEIDKSFVKTEFGYHIIKLTQKRETALPDFESVKPGLTNLAVRKALAEHVDALRSSADIRMRDGN